MAHVWIARADPSTRLVLTPSGLLWRAHMRRFQPGVKQGGAPAPQDTKRRASASAAALTQRAHMRALPRRLARSGCVAGVWEARGPVWGLFASGCCCGHACLVVVWARREHHLVRTHTSGTREKGPCRAGLPMLGFGVYASVARCVPLVLCLIHGRGKCYTPLCSSPASFMTGSDSWLTTCAWHLRPQARYCSEDDNAAIAWGVVRGRTDGLDERRLW